MFLPAIGAIKQYLDSIRYNLQELSRIEELPREALTELEQLASNLRYVYDLVNAVEGDVLAVEDKKETLSELLEEKYPVLKRYNYVSKNK